MNKCPVVHFEMPYKNAKRVSDFYAKVFGWKMVGAGEQMGNYVLAQTAETDKKGMLKSPGAINGGFYNVKDGAPEPSVVISVDDMKKSMAKVKKAGGKILSKPQEIPGVGMWVSFRDSEGTRVSMLQEMRK